ncbi:MAG: hypothetical protein L0Z62_33905 [Gemmataceae bacterium]|nr:hypothetical protein [Gemmataceae bacterium]
MKNTYHTRFNSESLRGASADFLHPTHPEPETVNQGGLGGEPNDLGATNWESFWIDLGGEG